MTKQQNQDLPVEPVTSRPYMPDYGIPAAQGDKGLLPWDWAVERLASAKNYWIATTQLNGRPHMAPVWGIWLEGVFYFSTGPRSRKSRNLAENPRCVVCPELADEPVIVEGVAEMVVDPALLRRVADTYSTKYQWPIEATPEGVRDQHGNEGPVFAIRPHVVFGWNEFPQDATRWVFDID